MSLERGGSRFYPTPFPLGTSSLSGDFTRWDPRNGRSGVGTGDGEFGHGSFVVVTMLSYLILVHKFNYLIPLLRVVDIYQFHYPAYLGTVIN